MAKPNPKPEPKFRKTPWPPVYTQPELVKVLGSIKTKPPTKARDEGIAQSSDPDKAKAEALAEFAINQLIQKGEPFFACELQEHMGERAHPRAFAQVVANARKEGLVKIVAWGRRKGGDGTLAALWMGWQVHPVREEMFALEKIRSYTLIPEGVGISSADVMHEFTEEECEGLEPMPTHLAARLALERLSANKGYFSAETLAAMLKQTRHGHDEARHAIAAVIRQAIAAKSVSVHDVLPSANPNRNAGKVLIYRGITQ